MPFISYVRHAPIAKSNTSISIKIFLRRLNIASVSVDALASLSRQNAFCQSLFYLNPTSFFVRFVSSVAIFKQSLMNFLLQLASLRNPCTSLSSYSLGYSIIAFIFSRSIRILLTLTINPRNATSFLKNSHFSSAIQHSAQLSLAKTLLTSLTCCSRDLVVNTSKSSMYAITIMSSRCLRVSFITS